MAIQDEYTKEPFSIGEIEWGLSNLPALIASASEKVAHARKKVLDAKTTLEVKRARIMINPEHGKCTAQDKKCIAISETEDEAMAVNNAENELEVAQLMLDRYEDYFVAVRKQGSLIENTPKGGDSIGGGLQTRSY